MRSDIAVKLDDPGLYRVVWWSGLRCWLPGNVGSRPGLSLIRGQRSQRCGSVVGTTPNFQLPFAPGPNGGYPSKVDTHHLGQASTDTFTSLVSECLAFETRWLSFHLLRSRRTSSSRWGIHIPPVKVHRQGAAVASSEAVTTTARTSSIGMHTTDLPTLGPTRLRFPTSWEMQLSGPSYRLLIRALTSICWGVRVRLPIISYPRWMTAPILRSKNTARKPDSSEDSWMRTPCW